MNLCYVYSLIFFSSNSNCFNGYWTEILIHVPKLCFYTKYLSVSFLPSFRSYLSNFNQQHFFQLSRAKSNKIYTQEMLLLYTSSLESVGMLSFIRRVLIQFKEWTSVMMSLLSCSPPIMKVKEFFYAEWFCNVFDVKYSQSIPSHVNQSSWSSSLWLDFMHGDL